MSVVEIFVSTFPCHSILLRFDCYREIGGINIIACEFLFNIRSTFTCISKPAGFLCSEGEKCCSTF
jgi:hypothetical protein